MNLKNNTLSLKTIVGLIIILIFLTLLSYRDFLITIKLMLFHFYDFPMLPLDPYYKIILLFDGFEVTANVSQDSEVAFVFNAEKEFDFGVVKTGVKVKSREKDVDDYIIVYDGWGDNTLADMNPQTNSDWFFADQTFSQQADPSLVWAMKDRVDEMDVDFEDDISRDFTTTEDIFAAYIQNTYTWDKAVVVAGMRYENTSVDSQAHDQVTLAQTTASSDH